MCNYEETRAKMKNLIILISILISNLIFGQQNLDWSFNFKLKIDTQISAEYQFIDMDFYFNESYNFDKYHENYLKFYSNLDEYKIWISYSCISCGFSYTRQPPDIYIKVNVKDIYGIYFSTLIPIYFEIAEEEFNYSEVDLGTIRLSDFFAWSYEGGVVKEPYRILMVKADKSIHKSRNEYQLRKMDKLVKFDLEDEKK